MINQLISYFIKNKHLIYFFFSIITLATLLLTLLPSEQLGQHRLFQFDKLGHFLLFFSWTLLFGLLSFSKQGIEKTRIITVFFIGSLFGVSIELFQIVLPYGRSADIYDGVADIIGSLSAATLLYFIRAKHLQNE